MLKETQNSVTLLFRIYRDAGMMCDFITLSALNSFFKITRIVLQETFTTLCDFWYAATAKKNTYLLTYLLTYHARLPPIVKDTRRPIYRDNWRSVVICQYFFLATFLFFLPSFSAHVWLRYGQYPIISMPDLPFCFILCCADLIYNYLSMTSSMFLLLRYRHL